MLSSTTNIKIAIEYLHWIQSNLQTIQGLPADWGEVVPVDLPAGYYEFDQCEGLCDNILLHLFDHTDVNAMFKAWPLCHNTTYPCGDQRDFAFDTNLYLNPKRLELIKHCIKYMQDELEKRDAQED